MKKIAATQLMSGLLITALGGWVLLGWILQNPAWIQIRPQFVAMVINTACCFALLGIALLSPLFLQGNNQKIVQTVLGWVVVGLASLVMMQIIFRVELGIDWRDLHSWLHDGNPHPGRMAPNTALGFILSGLTLVLSQNVRHKVTGTAIQAFTLIVFILGVTGLVGYSIQLELLYSWFTATRMALPTAIGMILVSFGLWSSWHRASWFTTRQYFRDDEKIAIIGAGLLIVVGVTIGVGGFAFQQNTLEKTLSENLPTRLNSQITLFQSELNQIQDKAESAANRLLLIQLIRALNAEPQNKLLKEELASLIKRLSIGEVKAIAIYSSTQQKIIQLGDFSAQPELETDLGFKHTTILFWDRGLSIRNTVPIYDKGRFIGLYMVQEAMPLFTAQMMSGEGLGETGEAALCRKNQAEALCYPQYRNPRVYRAKRITINGMHTPMSLALQGKTGVFKGLDYRDKLVIAAHTPLMKTGLGIVVKKDTKELFTPIREQMQWSIPLLLLLTGLGAVILHAQIMPLASRLLRSEREANEKEMRIRTIVEGVGEGIITLDSKGIIESFNKGASIIFGYSPDEVIGKNIQMLMPEDIRAQYSAGMDRYLAGGEARIVGKQNVELPGLHKNGTQFQLELAFTEIVMNGRHLFTAIVRDITARKQAEIALFVEKERLRVTLGSIGDGVITTDRHGNVTYINHVGETMTGWSHDEAIGKPLLEVFNIINSHTGEVAFNPVEMVLRDENIAGLAEHTVLAQRGGQIFAIEDSAAPIRDIEGRIIGVVLVFHDVSQARLMAIEMTHQASHDALTGLINRREFERRLELAIQSGKRENKKHTLLYLDLDQFKIVNDTCGHVAGDDLLRKLTSILQHKLRQGDTLARLGGDEFGVLLESCPTEPGLRIAEVLRQTVREFHFTWADKVFPIGVSIGLVTFSNGGVLLADVLRMADAACYVAKDKGRNRVHVYMDEDSDVAQRHGEMGWVGRIQKALDENYLELYSQKILPLAEASEHAHFEVLLRMKDENGTLIPPMAFIPAAERYGLMPTLDRWVVRTTFAYCAKHHAHADSEDIIAINLSGLSLCDEKFLDFVLEQFAEFNLPYARICFEITETAAITNLANATAFIGELKSKGCWFSLDDFGSGMSSFAYLKHLQVDYLKIDGAFVKDMLHDPIDCAMVEAINHIGHLMGKKTIAEFVENAQIQQKLSEIGVDFVQGYGIEKPRPLQP